MGYQIDDKGKLVDGPYATLKEAVEKRINVLEARVADNAELELDWEETEDCWWAMEYYHGREEGYPMEEGGEVVCAFAGKAAGGPGTREAWEIFKELPVFYVGM